MELTIDQALQKGVKAHKSRQYDEAAKYYRLILETQPKHPDVNHNLGVLEVEAGNLAKAILFLRTALEANPNLGQYWFSYIDALIKLEALGDARYMLSQARKRGAMGEAFDQLEYRITNPTKSLSIISSIEKFYRNSKSTIVSNAAQGWLYTATIDKQFMEKKPLIPDMLTTPEEKEETLHTSSINENDAPPSNAGELIISLNEEEEIVEKLKKLKALIQFEDLNLINDSFAHHGDVDIVTAQERTFNGHGLNIVLIGAGVTGLFLANIIKFALGDDVNILVLDNRSNKQNTRKPFSREWLTHIPAELVQKYTPPNIRGLLECFGKNGFIGLQINMLETVLMLSCKEQGVKFYFSPKLNYSKLDSKSIDFFFDATGGRRVKCEYPISNTQQNDLKLQDLVKDFNYSGINTLNNVPHEIKNNLEITLKASDAFHFPYIGNSQIYTPIIKLTGIPENLLKEVHEFIEPRNTSNLFFIWQGDLRSDFNEGLVFINLTNKEHSLLNSCIQGFMNLNLFLINNKEILSSLDSNIEAFLQMLVKLDSSRQIKISQPFSYSPYINLDAGFGYFEGKRIFPVGDSYFCGNPKVGNGLWTHFGFINDLVQRIVAAHEA